MKKLQKYTGTKTYMFPNGSVATPEAVLKNFPACLQFAHIVETDEGEEVMFAMQNLSAMRTFHKIDQNLSEEEAITAIETIINTEPEPFESPEDRQATALEAIAMGATSETTEIINALLGEV